MRRMGEKVCAKGARGKQANLAKQHRHATALKFRAGLTGRNSS